MEILIYIVVVIIYLISGRIFMLLIHNYSYLIYLGDDEDVIEFNLIIGMFFFPVVLIYLIIKWISKLIVDLIEEKL